MVIFSLLSIQMGSVDGHLKNPAVCAWFHVALMDMSDVKLLDLLKINDKGNNKVTIAIKSEASANVYLLESIKNFVETNVSQQFQLWAQQLKDIKHRYEQAIVSQNAKGNYC